MQRRIRVFLVEDDKAYCNAVRDYFLGTQDIELVGLVHDGVKALELLPVVNPDIVIIDISLPELDGLRVMEKMRDIKFNIRPIIIVATANSRSSNAKIAYDNGAEFIVIKPYKVEDLVERIRTLYNFNSLYSSEDLLSQTTEVTLQNTPKYKIMTILNQYGIPSNRVGYQFLIDALLMTMDEPDSIDMITKRIYPQIAKKYKTTHGNVERGIRHSIEIAWRNTSEEVLTRLYGNAVNPLKGRPTNSEFISNIAQKLQIETTLTS